MNTKQAVALAGTKYKLAKLLGITPQAVQAWGDIIPALRLYQLRERKPEWFTESVAVEKPESPQV